ncbi:MAG: hypothetical protein ISQ34_03100 [Rickettsiales bacterium]|nr:hypothetical protein [Rickettsiales bacterium]
MKHHDLVRNPIFKIVGIGCILYFALFANKHDNRSLSKRYSVDNIKESVENAAKKKRDIARKVSEAKKQKEKMTGINNNVNQLKNNNEKE